MNKNSRMIIIFLFLQSVIHNLGHPITPSFVRALGIPDYMFGLFFAAMSFGLMIGAPIWGILSDRGHRKLWIAIGLTCYTIGQIGFGFVGEQYLMVLFRLFAGLGVVSAVTIYTALIVEQTEAKERAKILAFTAASSTLGASVGYYIGGFLATNTFMHTLFHTQNLANVFIIQSVLNALYTLFVVLSIGDVKVRVISAAKTSMLKSLKAITKIDKRLLIFLVSVTLMNMAATNLSKYIDVYFRDLGYSESDLGTFVMVTGIVSLFASVFIVKYANRYKKQLHLIMIMHIVSAAIVFYVFRSINFLVMMYTVYMLYVVFKALYIPLEQAYISKEAKEGYYGSIMGIRQSFVSLGMVLGPVIGGFLYNYKPLLLFDFSAVIFLIGVILLGIVSSLEKPKQAVLNKENI